MEEKGFRIKCPKCKETFFILNNEAWWILHTKCKTTKCKKCGCEKHQKYFTVVNEKPIKFESDYE